MNWPMVALILGLVWAVVAVFGLFMWASLTEKPVRVIRQEVV